MFALSVSQQAQYNLHCLVQIEFKDVKMRYRPGLPLVLKGLNVCIEAGTTCGVVGRTGTLSRHSPAVHAVHAVQGFQIRFNLRYLMRLLLFAMHLTVLCRAVPCRAVQCQMLSLGCSTVWDCLLASVDCPSGCSFSKVGAELSQSTSQAVSADLTS